MIKRESCLQKIRPFMGRDVIKILTGIRRCGKSVMLGLIQEELVATGETADSFVALDFTSHNLPCAATTKAVHAFAKKKAAALRGSSGHDGKLRVFLDEIQELSGWEKLVNALLSDFDADIYLTGSNARLLSGELATYLGGRYVQIRMHPFSYAEFLLARSASDSRALFENYLVFGGMPFLSVLPLAADDAKKYLSDIFDSIVLKDIVSRHAIRDVELLRRVILYFLANVGNTFSASSLVKFLKNEKRTISTETIYNYIEYCKAAHLLHLLPREDVRGKRILQFQEKIFLADTGLREALLGGNLADIGQILENVVLLELLRRDYQVTVGREERGGGGGGREVDFVATRGGNRIYVQVCYLLADNATVEREFSVLETIPDAFPKYVVSMDEINRGRNGVLHFNIRDFLLGESF
ncbi:MAG: ATP-binding protein [Opitutaceae bacterium]|jgi:predicted AAA+ superfamily ATPase|nr:ATP-binding protein [Opitutaceae bacterium]